MLKRIVAKLTSYSATFALNRSARKGYFHQTGWTRSFRRKQSVDARGEPLPWFTYPAIAFLEPRLDKNMLVFEYGCGNSTLWWCAHTGKVCAVEHDRSWLERIRRALPQNGEIIHIPGDDRRYAAQIGSHGGEFHIVVIDGEARLECARSCLPALRPDGVIIWDNSERPPYQSGLDFLAQRGFRRLDFFGMGPINPYAWCTSVLYRSGNNCLRL
ncbi:MAG: class I SAM-dependent methyltransferase [Steroidobacteraceae bacterium]